MIFRVFALLFVVRACMAVFVTINGTEVDCEGTCACCKGGIERCRSVDAYCLDGCVDTIWGNSCKSLCKENCLRCEREKGMICNTCKNYYYELSSFCTKTCSVACEGGTCNDNGTCSNCVTNFEGNKCDTCIQGRYGPTCLEVCDHLNCRCIERDRCDSCKAGFYDINTFCQTQCSTGCLKAVCNDDGSCMCRPGFKGSTCSECISGFHGQNCNKLCSAGCVNGQCLQDGTCSCHVSFTGPTCETCMNGRYGVSCDQVCSEGCATVACGGNDGVCECLAQFSGDKCDQCKSGFYGRLCDLHCPGNCEEGTCSRYGATCTNGCVNRFSGDNCTTPCDSACATCLQYDKSYCSSCYNGYTGSNCTCPPNCNCELESDICTSCVHGYSNPKQKCKCQSRYCTGVFECDQCINQTFYVDSNECCECPENCKDGTCKSGPVCVSGCIDGFYGLDCSESCFSVSLDCVRCNQADGKCLSCYEGLYPHEHGNCVSCNRNCKNGKCNSETGSCIDGCEEMFWGDKCDILCGFNCEKCTQDSGICDACANTTFHGYYCNETCSSLCIERKCDRGTGYCINGCSGDFYGNLCQFNCPSNCLQTDSGTSCSADGHCKYGCKDGFEGSDCSAIITDPPVAALVGGLIGGVVVFIGVVVTVVFVVRSRLSASNKCNTNGNTRVPANMTDERAKQRSSNSPGQDYEHLDHDQRRTSQEQRVYEILEITPDKQDPTRARREEGDANYESIHDYYNARI